MCPVPVKNRLKIAVEDRFIILKLRQDKALLPEGDLLDFIAPYLGSFDETYSILCDWRGLQNVTHDVIDFVELLCREFGATILAEHKDVDEIHSCLGSQSPRHNSRYRLPFLPSSNNPVPTRNALDAKL